jgi:hypothetical protein
MKCAVVVAVVGDKYRKEYDETFKKHTTDYCMKYGYDHLLITNFPAMNKYGEKVICMLKWQIASQPEIQIYDRIILMDADMVITKACPPIHELDIPPGKIGMVDQYSQPCEGMELVKQKVHGWEKTATEYYQKYIGMPMDTKIVFNGGLLIFNPASCSPFLEKIFSKHIEDYTKPAAKYVFEQTWLSKELQDNDRSVLLDNKWNFIWLLWKLPEHRGNMSVEEYYKKLCNETYIIHHCSNADYHLAKDILPSFSANEESVN